MSTPDGIDEPIESAGLWDRHASPISILLLGALMLVALSGLVGGQPNDVQTRRFESAEFSVKTPQVIRNGEFFETQIIVTANDDLDDAVVAVTPALWRDMTINTMIPAASDERFEDGIFRFSYGPLAKGEALRVKIDGQINPPLFAGTRGEISVYDGKRRIGAMPVAIKVMP